MPEEVDDLEDKILEGSLDEYLVGLAEGIAQAQQTLNEIAVETGPGLPKIQYQMPKIDFELKVSLELKREESSSGPKASGLSRFRKGPRQVMNITKSINDATEASLASTIKGSFVAVPLGNGQPLPQLTLEVSRDKNELTITAFVYNTAGEPLTGELVQFNIDREHSKELNSDAKLPANLRPDTQFMKAEVETDEHGKGGSTLNINKLERNGMHIVIVVDAAQQSETLIYRVKKG